MSESIRSIQPKLIIHGGAGSSLKGKDGLASVRQALHTIVAQVYQSLLGGKTATEAVVLGCQLLENNPRFNAGTGSVLQSDGNIRMSASLMDGQKQSFSGVINVAQVKNPIEIARFLQSQDDRVLSDYGSIQLARELQIPLHNPLTELRLQEWLAEREGNFNSKMAGVVAENSDSDRQQGDNARRGTIGVVALDQYGDISAGTSTGGKGLERVGRVSDSAMPAGNYANKFAGVSCTGIGEDIIDECLAAKIVIRVTDGMSLQDAMQKSMEEGKNNQRDFGAIAVDNQGNIVCGKTSEVLLSAYHNGESISDCLEWHDQGSLISIA